MCDNALNEVQYEFGSNLRPDVQRMALSIFRNRYTRDHKPWWVRDKTLPDGSPYPVQFASDRDWLENTTFAVTRRGRLDRRVIHCNSKPTWPDNTELRS